MQKILALVLCWFLASSMGYAQTDDWNAVTALSPGTLLRIELGRGREAEGVLQEVDDTQLTLEERVPAPRAEIRKVEQLGVRKTGKLARWGFLIGAVSGASWGYGSTVWNRGIWALFRCGLGPNRRPDRRDRRRTITGTNLNLSCTVVPEPLCAVAAKQRRRACPMPILLRA